MNAQKKMISLEENYGKNILPLSLVDNDRFPGGRPVELVLFYKEKILYQNSKSVFSKPSSITTFSQVV